MIKVALVYDRVNKWGGAERVLLALHEIFPDAPLYTSVYNPNFSSWANVFPKVVPSFLQKIPFAKNWHEGFGWLMPIAFESFSAKGGFDEYDLVISVTSEAAKGIITKPGTLHICYCLTPTRYLWSGYDIYFKNPILRSLSKPVVLYLRKWDKVAAQRPDVMIAISLEVVKRIKKYYGREAAVIYPPVKLAYSPACRTGREKRTTDSKKKYYLVVNRLVPYKKAEVVMEAFNQLKWPLVVVGTGSEERRLKSMSKSKNIKFVGEVTDSDLINYYQGARALIMPQEEDFGIVSVEAQAAGVPVIAYKKGGAKDTVIEGRTGLFFDQQTPECLINALYKFDKMTFDGQELLSNAKKFSKERFQTEFKKLVDKYK